MDDGIIGIIGGSGLGQALVEHIYKPQHWAIETPFGKPSSEITVGKIGSKKVAFLNRHGNGHKIGPSEIPFAANIFALKKIGVTTLISTGAVGSLRDGIAPGDLVVVDQFIDKTFKRQNTLFSGFGVVHCEMAEPVCSRLSEIVLNQTNELEVTVHPKGTYICMEGPQFSTKAESLMHQAWGGDLIGMTAMPEAKLAKEAQMCYCLVALASDYDCWRPHDIKKDKQSLLKEIISNLSRASENCLQVIKAVLENDIVLKNDACACRKSLELAVWTDNDGISKEEKEKLEVLFD